MEFMVGPNWKDYFNVLIVQARKPKFFTDLSRPIRVFDERSGTHIWDRVNKLEKGVIYYEVIVEPEAMVLALVHTQIFCPELFQFISLTLQVSSGICF